MPTKRHPRAKRCVHSFEADPDIEAVLKDVLRVTGLSQKELMNSALREYIPRFIQSLSDAQERTMRDILETLKSGGAPGNKTATAPRDTRKSQ